MSWHNDSLYASYVCLRYHNAFELMITLFRSIMASEVLRATLVVKELTWWPYNCIWKVSKHVPVVPPGYVYMWLWFMTLMILNLDLLMSSYLAPGHINSLAPGRFEGNFRWVNFKLIVVIDGWCISCEIAIRWMPLDITDDKSTLVQVMAWCRQATSHYLSQCWPSSMSPYGVTRPQWVRGSIGLTKYQYFFACFNYLLTLV